MRIKPYKSNTLVVALGNNRSNGLNLGSFYVNANNGLGNSNGNNWRARPYLFAGPGVDRLGVLTKSETPHKAFGTARRIRRFVVAVKHSRKGSVSRADAFRRTSRKATAHKGTEVAP